MKAKRFRCRHCGELKLSRKKGQMYCGERACQKARKSRWRREKYAEDLDYRINQRESTQLWLESVGGAAKYYRGYRKKRKRRQVKPEAVLVVNRGSISAEKSLFAKPHGLLGRYANRDAISRNSLLKSGRYFIFPIGGKYGANRDAIRVEIEVISDG